MRNSFPQAYLRMFSFFTMAALCLAQAPAINTNGVTNGGSFLPGIASGSWITIKGTNLSTTTRTWANADFKGNVLPLSLDGVNVKVNNKDAPVYFISPTQINALAPADAATGSVGVAVTTPLGTSPIVNATMQRLAPAWFAFSQQGGVYPAAVHLNGTYVGPTTLFGTAASATPAQPNERILLFGTGFGQTAPAVDPLVVFSGTAPLATPNDLKITVGGQAATIEFAGLVSNGEYQFNIIVPNLPDGEQDLIATIGGIQTQTLRLAVQGPQPIPSITGVSSTWCRPAAACTGTTLPTVPTFWPDRLYVDETFTINGAGFNGTHSAAISPSDCVRLLPLCCLSSRTSLTGFLQVSPDASIGPRTLTVTTLGGTSNPFPVMIVPVPINAPSISNLTLNSSLSSNRFRVQGSFDFTDSDGDIRLGRSRGQTSVSLQRSLLGP